MEEILREVLARVDKAASEAHDLNHVLAQEIIDMHSTDGEEDLPPTVGQEVQEDGKVQVQPQEVAQSEE